jgi:hypothetical protein
VIRAGIIEKYSVQYEALIGGRWKAITRFDSVHGGPHRHIYRGSGKDLRVATPYFNFNEAFTSAQEFVKKNFASMKENYLLSSRGGV